MRKRNRAMHITTAADGPPTEQNDGSREQRRNLVGACLAHLLHDGYTDQLYALLPVWQPEFGLSYAGLAVVRSLYYGTMGSLQLPADRLAAKLSSRVVLAMATFIAAAGFLVVALPFGFPGLCIGLIIAGIGSSVQHPRASAPGREHLREGLAGPPRHLQFRRRSWEGDPSRNRRPVGSYLRLASSRWVDVSGWTRSCLRLAGPRAQGTPYHLRAKRRRPREVMAVVSACS